jgi:hypothetical protein
MTIPPFSAQAREWAPRESSRGEVNSQFASIGTTTWTDVRPRPRQFPKRIERK